jgi:hypothetical protein
MRWRYVVLTALVVLTLAMALLFLAFCFRLATEGDATPMVYEAITAGLLTVFGVWASERCYRDS